MQVDFFQSSLKSEDEFNAIQTEISPFMHSTLVNWLIQVTKPYIEPNTFCLGIHIMDEYIARIMVPVKKFQLLGCTCILLAAKLEQIVVCFRRVINCAVPNIARDDRCRV
jgi:hypothetical protein